MVGERIDRQADDLDAAPVKLGLDLGHVTELGGAYRCEILRVREQHRPLVADPIVKPNPTFGSLSLEVRGSIVDCESHRPSLLRPSMGQGSGKSPPAARCVRRSVSIPRAKS